MSALAIPLWPACGYLPSNHQPTFGPEPRSTLRVGVRALTSGALTYLPIAGAI